MIKIKCHPNANPNPMIDEALNNIEKKLEVLEILKNRSYIIWVEKGVLYSGRDGDIQVPLDKEDFESEEDYKLIKEWLNE